MKDDMKRNTPQLAPNSSEILSERAKAEEDGELLALALDRLRANSDKPAISADQVYAELGIDMDQVNAADEVELE
jgi:hypothetical protein